MMCIAMFVASNMSFNITYQNSITLLTVSLSAQPAPFIVLVELHASDWPKRA